MKKLLTIFRDNLVLFLMVIWGIYESIMHTGDTFKMPLAIVGSLMLLYCLIQKILKDVQKLNSK